MTRNEWAIASTDETLLKDQAKLPATEGLLIINVDCL